MPRYPDFFVTHAVLPSGVSDPTDRTPWEEAVIQALRDARDAGNAGTGASWAVGDSHGERDHVLVSRPDEEGEDQDLDWDVPEDPNLRSPDELEGSALAADGGDYGGTDTIARYLPWHLHGADWGIYFDGPAFWRHVRHTEAELGPGASVASAVVVRDVFEQVLAHERTHFAGEVLGTELEGRLARAGYRDYVLTGYSFRNPWTSGAPEEILATHTEVNGASAGALKKAAKAIASRAPAGYSEWGLARDERRRRTIEATIAARMVPGAGASATWSNVGRREAQAVPLYWRLAGIWLPSFLRRAPARLTPRAVRDYLRRHGFQPVARHTAGHHHWFEYNGVIASYSIQGGEIPKKEHSRLAKSLGFSTPIELRRAIVAGDPPPALLAV